MNVPSNFENIMEDKMNNIQWNPVSLIINLVIGWFFAALIQSFVFALAAGGWKDLWPHVARIALFRDGIGVLINFAIVIIGGGIGIALWLALRK